MSTKRLTLKICVTYLNILKICLFPCLTKLGNTYETLLNVHN